MVSAIVLVLFPRVWECAHSSCFRRLMYGTRMEEKLIKNLLDILWCNVYQQYVESCKQEAAVAQQFYAFLSWKTETENRRGNSLAVSERVFERRQCMVGGSPTTNGGNERSKRRQLWCEWRLDSDRRCWGRVSGSWCGPRAGPREWCRHCLHHRCACGRRKEPPHQRLRFRWDREIRSWLQLYDHW